jgi:ComEC/Rec2-related protein
MLAMRAGFALVPTFSARWPVKKYAAGTALMAAAFYLLMSGSDVAAQRSFLMLAVMLIAILVDRSALTMRNLAISAIIILLISPHEVVGPSFQMSFAATAALVAAYAAWTGRREGKGYSRALIGRRAIRILGKTTKYAAGMAMTSVVAGTATALFSAWHFHQVSPMGLFANVAAMPFVSVLVMPMAVLAAVLMPLGLDGPPLQVMGFGISAMNTIAFWLAERSAFDTTGAIPLPAVLTLTAALTILTMSGSSLRWSAAPLLLIGAILLLNRTTSNVMISEDARTVAMVMENGQLAVNRDRPQAFTIDNWQRAIGTVGLLKPVSGENPDSGGFACDDAVCIGRHSSGRQVVHSKNEEAAKATCKSAALIIIEDATAGDPCGNGVVVVTARDLARRGSAEVTLGQREGERRSAIRFSFSEPYRPWHEHRRYSRAARGLAPYQRPH